MSHTDEDKKIEVKYTGGVGAFFYAGIFWILAIGALAWISVAQGCIEFHHHLTLAERMDNRVGVREPLKNPVKVIIPGKQGCMAVMRTFADGDSITLYLHNGCNHDLGYYAWGWKAKAPDGTVINQHFDNSIDRLGSGTDIEEVMELPDDDRIATLTVWSSEQP